MKMSSLTAFLRFQTNLGKVAPEKLVLALGLVFLTFSAAQAQTTNSLLANFDNLPVGSGTNPLVLTDEGISFSNCYSDSTGDQSALIVESTTDMNLGFSLPNYLTAGSDTNESFGNIYSLDISFSGIATNATLDVGCSLGDPNESNTLTLEAFNGTNIVATDTWSGYNTNGYNDVSGTLSTSWAPGITSLMLVVNVLDNTNIYGADSLAFGIDNVDLLGTFAVPEPSGNGLLGCLLLSTGALFYLRFRAQRDRKTSMLPSPSSDHLL